MEDEKDDLSADASDDVEADDEFAAEDLDEEDLDEEDLDAEDLVDPDLDEGVVGDDVGDDPELVEIPVADLDEDVVVDVVEEAEAPPRPERPTTGDDDEDDDDVVDPNDVEEDLATILRDPIAAGTDAEEEDEEVGTEDRTETGDRVSPRKPEEVSCSECFLLV